MNLKDILAISGYPGLFKLVSQAKNGIIVESIIDGKRFQAFSTHKVSALEDVAIFTREGETPLKEIFIKIFKKEQGGPAINHKTSTVEAMKSYFLEILPEYDQERVYMSDIKKVLMWYNTLHQVNMLNLPEDENDKEEQEGRIEETMAKNAKTVRKKNETAKKKPDEK